MYENDIKQAAEFIRNPDALLITAGAGMGVDSGQPDFVVLPVSGRLIPPWDKRE